MRKRQPLPIKWGDEGKRAHFGLLVHFGVLGVFFNFVFGGFFFKFFCGWSSLIFYFFSSSTLFCIRLQHFLGFSTFQRSSTFLALIFWHVKLNLSPNYRSSSTFFFKFDFPFFFNSSLSSRVSFGFGILEEDLPTLDICPFWHSRLKAYWPFASPSRPLLLLRWSLWSSTSSSLYSRWLINSRELLAPKNLWVA